MKTLDGICNLNVKDLEKVLRTEKKQYAILFLYDESQGYICEKFLMNNALSINNRTNIQIPFFTRYTKEILERLRGNIEYDEINNHFSKYDGKVNSYEIMRIWANKLDIELDAGRIQYPTFVILSVKDISNPIVFQSKNIANNLKYDFERIINVLMDNYSDYYDVCDKLSDVIESRQNKKSKNIFLYYDLYKFVDDKRIEQGIFKWEKLNNYLGYRDRNALQRNLKNNSLKPLQLISIALCLKMDKKDIEHMFLLAEYPHLEDYDAIYEKVLDCLDQYDNYSSFYDRFNKFQSIFGKKLPIDLEQIYD